MYRKIYFMGVKGVGMAPLAVIAKQAGFIVAGSDISEEFITDKILKDLNIHIYEGFSKDNVEDFLSGIASDECLFIATGAHDGFDNEEAIYAKQKGIKVVSHGQAVGLFMSGDIFERNDIEGVSVLGAHGKTTVSAMLSTVLSLASYDPSYAVGTSEIIPIGPSGHYGKGRYFIAEADEYVSELNHDRIPKFLYQKPKTAIINNIDFDHPDYYKDVEAVKNAYLDFLFQLDDGSLVVANGDDEHTMDVIKKLDGRTRVITFGAGENNEFVFSDFKQEGLTSSFTVKRGETEIGEFTLSVPGYHNAKNACGVIACLMELGVSVSKISEALSKFGGSKRRIEVIGQTRNGQVLIDDYAHHPEEIKKTLSAIKTAFPSKKLITIFQFHTFSRTKALLSDFISSFSDTDELILIPTFASQRDLALDREDKESGDLDSKVIDEFRKINKQAVLIPQSSDVLEYIEKNYTDSNSVVITMGAGDVYKIGYKLKS